MTPNNVSFVLNSTGPVGREVTYDWRRWVAVNLLRRVPPEALVETMVKDGFAPQVAAAEVRAALAHPYLDAARTTAADAAPAAPGTADAALKKRDWVLEVYRRSARQAGTAGTVPRVVKPSRRQFLDDFYSQNRPVVIERAIDDWPALTRWTGGELARRFGDRVVEVQANRTSDDQYEMNSTRLKKDMRFGDYVALVESGGETNDFYMTANNAGKNRDALKELWDDIVLVPEYLRGDDPQNRGFFWYGPKGTVTPLHHDLTNNFMAQVRGRKLVRLIAPYDLPNLYNHRHCFSQVDLDRVDRARFPKFGDARVIDVEIGPGDLFFLPVGWWHHVRGLDVSITMTFTNFVFDNDFYSSYTTYDAI